MHQMNLNIVNQSLRLHFKLLKKELIRIKYLQNILRISSRILCHYVGNVVVFASQINRTILLN